jgi:hypothetical protein
VRLTGKAWRDVCQGVDALRLSGMVLTWLAETPETGHRQDRGRNFGYAGFISRAAAEFVARNGIIPSARGPKR